MIMNMMAGIVPGIGGRVGLVGWPSGDSTCLPPMWPGLDFRTRCHVD